MTSRDRRLPPDGDTAVEFQQASTLHGQGHIGQAAALYEHILKKQPRHSQALHHLGVIAYQTGDVRKAADLIAKAIRISPENAAFHSNYGLALQDLGELDAALKSFGRAIALQPGLSSALSNRGDVLRMLGRYDEALATYERAAALAPQDPTAIYNRALVLQTVGRSLEAVAGYDQAIALAPAYCDAHINRGNVLQSLNRFEESIDAYSRALSINADMAIAYANRGTAYQKLQCLDKALADFNRALDLDKAMAFAYMGRGVVHKHLGHLDEAAADLSQALALDPNDFEARKNFLWIHLLHFRDPHAVEQLTNELARIRADIDTARLRSNKRVQNFRLIHDLEQTARLKSEGGSLDSVDVENARAALAARVQRESDDGSNSMTLSSDELEMLTSLRTNVLRYAPHLPKAALNPENDWTAIETRYLEATPEIVVIDDFLTPDALRELRKFCLSSTVWRTEYDNAYLGAFPEDGFMSPLHLQIAAELRRALPRIIGDHALEQLWAFKYSSQRGKGIGLHADFARVNLNFWITPDDANLDPTSGGMEVYDVPAPREWGFHEYNSASDKIATFLQARNSASQIIPYKCNRAVLFNSNLFHETSQIRFKEGYENRRINVTYLFGVGQKFT